MISYFDVINVFLLGLAASLQPCLFPVLPTFVAFLSNTEANRKRGIVAGSIIGLGMLTVFLVLIFLSQSLISYFSLNYLNFRTAQGVFLIIFGIILMVGFSFSNSFIDRLSSFANSLLQKSDNVWLTSYLIGLLFTLLAAPCAFIIFVTAFAIILPNTTFVSSILMLIFTIGATLPFLMVGGLIPSFKERLISDRRRIERIVSLMSGILIIFTGVYLFLDGMRLL